MARCAPLLAALPQSIALLEVGASAGLCLYPDGFGYRCGNLPPLAPAGYWISNEIPSAVAFGSPPPSPDPTRLLSVLAQDGPDHVEI